MDRANDPLVGTQIGDYLITGLIDQGGMGLVYTAEHVTLKNKTACKVLRRELLGQEEMSQRFLQEAKLISQIRHPNLIDIFDIGELPDGRLYYVMEFLSGRSLATAMSERRLEFPEIVSVIRQVCAGLGAAHAAGIVHRDLKPDNIFLVEKPGEPAACKIVDFGIAKAQGTNDTLSGASQVKTRTGYLLGTPQYMSPEQINGGAIDGRSDVYALGVIIYELCTGKPPFRGETLGQLLIAHVSQLPALDPTALGPGVPALMEPIIQKALAKDPNDRYQSTLALAQDLSKLVSGEATEAATWFHERRTHLQTGRISTILSSLSGVTVQTQPKQARIFLAVLGAAIVLIMAVGGIGGYMWFRYQNSKNVKPTTKMVKRVVKRAAVDMLALRSEALKLLQTSLADPEPQPRLVSLGALAASRDTRHLSLIMPKLEDPDAAVQRAAAHGIGQLGSKGGATALLTKAEKATDPLLLVAIGESLDKLGDPGSDEVLGRLMKGKVDPKAQLQAALLIEKRGDKKATKYVNKRLKKPLLEEDTAVILTSRAKLGDQNAQRALIEEMKAMAPSVQRLKLAGTLAKLDLEPGRTLLTQTMTKDGPAQTLAANLLCLARQTAGLPVLRKVFTEEGRSPPEKLLGIEGLGACGERQDAVVLSTALRAEKSPILRLAEAAAVLKLASGDPAVLAEQSLSWAQEALTDENWAVRESAVALLGDADPAAAVPLLGKAIRDGQAEVRRSAAAALGRTKYRPAVEVLSTAIADKNKEVRVNVLRAIGKVSTDLVKKGEKGLEGELRLKVQAELVKAADTGDPTEQVVAAATLMRIGDDSRKEKLQGALKANDPEIRALAVEESAADPVMQKASLASLLKDPDIKVRFGTACQLADQNDKQSVPVLREVLGKGGADGLRAYGLLKKLGETASPPSDLDKLADHPDVAVRLAMLDAAEQLPRDVALPILSKAATASEVAVRRRVVERLADWPAPTGTEPSPALPVARLLATDGDLVVRQRAGNLVSKLSPKVPEPVIETMVEEPVVQAPVNAPPPPPDLMVIRDLAKPPDLAVPPDLLKPPDLLRPPDLMKPPDLAPPPVVTPPPPVVPPGTEAFGLVTLTSMDYVQVQIDKKRWQFNTPKPQKLPAGPHTINTIAGPREIVVVAGQNQTLDLPPSPIEQGIADGIDAFKKREFEKSLKLIERSGLRCERSRGPTAQACVGLMAVISFYKGRLFETEGRPDAAANEFQRVIDGEARGQLIDGVRADAQVRLKNLSAGLGLVIFKTPADGQCSEERLWVSPGNPSIRHGGTQQVLRIRARQTVTLGECK
jgi:HEAT repeat protein/tRNA A-37 threonylcarbamoyl transferase component Bud32